MIKDIIEVAKKLKPPNDDSASESVVLWRWLMAGVVCFVLFGYGGLHLAAYGALPFVTGFASESEVLKLKDDLTASRIDYIENTAFQLRIRQCEVISEHKSPRVYTVQIEELNKKFRELTGQNLTLPTCGELK
jgi:hypothetical protein